MTADAMPSFTRPRHAATVGQVLSWSETLSLSGSYASVTIALETLRKDLSLSRREFARLTGVTERKLRQWGRGSLPPKPDYEDLIEHLTVQKLINKEMHDFLVEAYEEAIAHGPSTIPLMSDDIEINFDTNHQSRVNRPPEAPEQTSPGPTLSPTVAGFDIQIKPPPDAERTDPVQVSLYRRLQQHIVRLDSILPRISNTHAMLAAEFNAYRVFLATDLADLDVASLWSAGTGINEHVLAVSQAGSTAMTPLLEPDIAAELRGLMHDHTAFVLGFAIGRELHERIIRSREAARDNPDMQAQSQAVLVPMASSPHLLAEKARLLADALVKALSITKSATFDLLASSSNWIHSSIVAFARVLHPILLVGEATNLTLLFAGYEHAEVLYAAVIFLRDNMPTIAAVFAHDPQIAGWLAWVIQRLHDFPEH